MYKKYTGSLINLSKQTQDIVKQTATTFYYRETAEGHLYDIKYPNGYGIVVVKRSFYPSAKQNLWEAYLQEKTQKRGWQASWRSPFGKNEPCYFRNLEEADVINLCNQIRDYQDGLNLPRLTPEAASCMLEVLKPVVSDLELRSHLPQLPAGLFVDPQDK